LASDLPLRTSECCSVVFGVTLRLLVINTSSSPVKNKPRRLPATSVNNLPRSGVAVCIALGGRTVYSTRRSQILAENGHFCLPHLHSTPLGSSFLSEYCHDVLVWKKYRKTNLTVKKINISLLVTTEYTIQTPRRTDRQTPRDGIGRAYT